MCGIVGATSSRNVVPILIEGIRRLEYRGYDSTGLAVVNGGTSPVLERLVSTARVAPSRKLFASASPGIARALAISLPPPPSPGCSPRGSPRLRS